MDSAVSGQLAFYRSGKAGCLFAAYAAQDPARFEWRFSVCDPDPVAIQGEITYAIESGDISTQSIVLPAVASESDLVDLLQRLTDVESILLGYHEPFESFICLGYRVRVGSLQSYVTGFGDFRFLPATRQAPFTELTFRSKPRPPYEFVMKPAPDGVIHLADMDLKGMARHKMEALWDGSFDKTRQIIGHSPDLRSAAKTTFALPAVLADRTLRRGEPARAIHARPAPSESRLQPH